MSERQSQEARKRPAMRARGINLVIFVLRVFGVV